MATASGLAKLSMAATTACVVLSMGFVFVMLCGPSETFRRGPVGRLHRYITMVLPSRGSRLLRRLLGARLYGLCASAVDYSINQRNPFLQIFYLSLIAGGVATFVVSGGAYATDPRYLHPIHLVIIPLLIGATLLTFWIASNSNPGRVTKANAAAAVQAYPYDMLIFVPKQCSTCKVPRPARSKHCSYCDVCVARFDHHCGWINNCVGANNLRYFLLFLFMTAILCFYGTAVVAQILLAVIREKKLLQITYFDQVLQARRRLSYYRVGAYLLATEYGLVALGLFLTLVGLMLVSFALYHLYLVARGTTTNETFRWDDVHDYIKGGNTIVLPSSSPAARGLPAAPVSEPSSPTAGEAAPTTPSPTARRKPVASPVAAAKEGRSAPATEPESMISTVKHINNVYNRGFMVNLREVLAPPSYFR